MDFFEHSIVCLWLENSTKLSQQFFIVVVAAFALIRIEWLRLALRNADLSWQYRFITTLVFSTLAIFGSHNGLSIDIYERLETLGLLENYPEKVGQPPALINFSDTITLTAGLIGGPFVGTCVGFITGLESFLTDHGDLSNSISSLALGVFAGIIRYTRAAWILTEKGVLLVGASGTLLHFCILLLATKLSQDTLLYASVVIVPIGIVNSLGCVLFFWIMRDLDREYLENAAHEAHLMLLQAELRTFRAQVDPHFLNNTLNDLNSLIRRDPDRAREYIIKLADFFKYTREFSQLTSISLHQELAQLKRFLELQRLGLDDKLQDSFEIDEALLPCQVLPGSLLALVENSLKHGFKGRPAPYCLKIMVKEDAQNLILQVHDNGHGIPSDLINSLGKHPVLSQSKGGGVALYHLVQSLHLVFGERAKLNYESIIEKYTVATLTQPKWIIP
ncbi:MAG: LytS/YhcK type 5TM receptor domain-containing protein [Methylococcaceae bacterium]|jgi:LytS/YehU family sensor histidine kinase